MFNVFEEEELVQDLPPGVPKVPVHFVVVTPRPGQLEVVMQRVQQHIIDPLVRRKILLEFRVRNATPETFVAEAATLVVLELVVPVPWPITDWDVQTWRHKLGPDLGLVVAPGIIRPEHLHDDEAFQLAYSSALARAMVLPPALQVAARPPVPEKQNLWPSSCVERDKSSKEPPPVIPVTALDAPTLYVVDEASGRRRRLADLMTPSPGGTFVSGALLNTTMAEELQNLLPAQLQWKSAWRLVYSPRLHGVSLKTFYRRMQQEGPSLLLIQDHQGHVFGGFASTGWRQGDRYYGTGESFVFRCRQPMPKPVVSLARQLQATSPKSKTGVPSESAMTEAMDEALKLLDAWSTKVKQEAQRSEREALRQNKVTSVTEALDALLAGPDGGETEENQALDEAEDLNDLEVFHYSSKAKVYCHG